MNLQLQNVTSLLHELLSALFTALTCLNNTSDYRALLSSVAHGQESSTSYTHYFTQNYSPGLKLAFLMEVVLDGTNFDCGH